MGLFSFLKDAGHKLFGTGAANADTLKGEVAKNGLGSGLTVTMDGDTVKVSGTAKSTEEAEKIILSLGNAAGVAQVDDGGLIVEKETPKAVFYTVKKGDTLWKIAEEHYGKGQGAKYNDIVKANTPPVKNPDMIQPGWVLRIPPQA